MSKTENIFNKLKLSTTQVLNTYGIIPTLEEETSFKILKSYLPEELVIIILLYQQPTKQEKEYNLKVDKWYYSMIPKQCYATINYNIPVLIGFVEDYAVELHKGQYGDYIKFKNNNFSIKKGKFGFYIKYNNKLINFNYNNQKAIIKNL